MTDKQEVDFHTHGYKHSLYKQCAAGVICEIQMFMKHASEVTIR